MFVKGDKVICVDSNKCHHISQGGVYTVYEVRENDIVVEEVRFVPTNYNFYRFVLQLISEEKIKNLL